MGVNIKEYGQGMFRKSPPSPAEKKKGPGEGQ